MIGGVNTHVSVEADLHESRFEVTVGHHELHGAVRLVQRPRVRGDVLAEVEEVLVLDRTVVGAHRDRSNGGTRRSERRG